MITISNNTVERQAPARWAPATGLRSRRSHCRSRSCKRSLLRLPANGRRAARKAPTHIRPGKRRSWPRPCQARPDRLTAAHRARPPAPRIAGCTRSAELTAPATASLRAWPPLLHTFNDPQTLTAANGVGAIDFLTQGGNGIDTNSSAHGANGGQGGIAGDIAATNNTPAVVIGTAVTLNGANPSNGIVNLVSQGGRGGNGSGADRGTMGTAATAAPAAAS